MRVHEVVPRMTRIAVLVLLLANIMAFAYLDYAARRADDVAAQAQQVHPERIRLMTAQEVAALQRGDSACVEIGPFAAPDAARMRESVATLQPVPEVSERRDEAVLNAPNVFLRLRGLTDAGRGQVQQAAAGFAGVHIRPCPALPDQVPAGGS